MEDLTKDKEVQETVTPEAKEPETKVDPVEEKPAEEPKKDETTKVEDAEEVKVDVEALKNELKEANEKALQVDALTATIQTMTQDSENQKATIKEYEELLGNLIDVKMKQIPEDYKELIPENLNLKQKLSWLEKAESKGLFNKEEKKKPEVEVGKPMNVEVPTVDTNKLSASQLLKMAYNSVTK